MGDWCWLGPHSFQLIDDLLFWRPGGPVLPEHAEAVCQMFEQLIGRYSYALWLVDARASVPVGHATRLVYARWFAQTRRRLAVGSFGASLLARTAASLTFRGAQLTTRTDARNSNFESEAEARQFLAEQAAYFRSTAHELAAAE